jgi:HPr kinase/phosphorylase
METITHAISVEQMFQETGESLELRWVAGQGGGDRQLVGEVVQKPSLALIGHLNFVHPNRVQVLGRAEMDYLRHLDDLELRQSIEHLLSTELAAIIVAKDEILPPLLLAAADTAQVPLFVSPRQSPEIMRVLSHYLTQMLSASTMVHGVMLDVLTLGVLITGEAAIGKSELALELITRGHRLVADDMTELYAVAPDILEARCPPLLTGHLEVRGLGILDIRALFGETAVRGKKNLKLIVHLEQFNSHEATPPSRLEMHAGSVNILSVEVPRVIIPVSAGRNLAVLVEVAARNQILRNRGIDSAKAFIERHQQLIEP